MKLPFTKHDDESLISLIAGSNEEALAQLYDRYHRLVFSLAFAIVHDQATAEEITLDVFMRVWQKAGVYRPDQAKVSTWLTHITRNHSIDVLRRWSARPEGHSTLWDEEAMRSDPSDQNPVQAAEGSMQRERIQQALALLPEDQKQALFMAFFDGYSQSEIAEILKQPLGTVKTRIRLAMQKLRNFLQGEGYFGDTSMNIPSAYSISKEEKNAR